MKNKVEAIINDFYQSCGEAFEESIPVAARAIVDLVESQPVDRVQAMAALVSEVPGQVNLYFVPGHNGGAYGVRIFETHLTCWRRHGYQTTHCSTIYDDPCDHIRAVKLATKK